jgi:hypothetical protein
MSETGFVSIRKPGNTNHVLEQGLVIRDLGLAVTRVQAQSLIPNP